MRTLRDTVGQRAHPETAAAGSRQESAGGTTSGELDQRQTRELQELISAWAQAGACATASPLRHVPAGMVSHRFLNELARSVETAGGIYLSGMWRSGVLRPYGGVLEVVDGLIGRLAAVEPEIVEAYRLAVTNLLPASAGSTDGGNASLFRSGLAGFALHGDRQGLAEFYWRRDSSPFLISELLRLTLDAVSVLAETSGQPILIGLENQDLADAQERMWIELLASYGRRSPLLVCLCDQASRAPERSGEAMLLEGIPAAIRLLLEAASVFLLPFRPRELVALVPGTSVQEVAQGTEWLVAHRFLRTMGMSRLAIATAPLWQLVHEGLPPERRRRLHREALEVEDADPFAAAWHALEGGTREDVHRATAVALDRSWGLSALDEAVPLAEHYLGSSTDERCHPDLLLGLLSYDGGDFERADHHFDRLLEQPDPAIERATLLRLAGYNAIFGIGELGRGRELLEAALQRFEELGLDRESAAVRNSISFALFREGRGEEALAMESQSIEVLRRSSSGADFLLALLQLNMGRLLRFQGASDRALESFQGAGSDLGSDFSPYLLQLLHVSLAHLHSQRGEWHEALRELHHCLQLSRDFSGENVSYPALRALASVTGELQPGLLTRSDEAYLYLYCNLARACSQVGMSERAQALMDSVRDHWSFLGAVLDPLVDKVAIGSVAERSSTGPLRDRPPAEDERAEEECAEAAGPAPGGAVGTHDRFATETARALSDHEAVVRAVEVEDTRARVAQLLAAGQSVALVAPVSFAGAALAVDSLVLCDPRNAELAARLSAELNVCTAPRLRSVVCLPGAAALVGGFAPQRWQVMQSVSLSARVRDRFGAVAPYNLRAQVLHPEHNRCLFEIVEAFAGMAGIDFLGAAAFMVFGKDLAHCPASAIESYLVSAIDCLLIGDRLVEKRHGPDAAENLLALRPRLSQRASLQYRRGPGVADQLVVTVRSSSSRRYLRVDPRTRAIFALCDGTRTVAAIAEELSERMPGDGRLPSRLAAFLRGMYLQRAVCFEGAAHSAGAIASGGGMLGKKLGNVRGRDLGNEVRPA